MLAELGIEYYKYLFNMCKDFRLERKSVLSLIEHQYKTLENFIFEYKKS